MKPSPLPITGQARQASRSTTALLICVTLSSTIPIHLLVPLLPQIQADLGIGQAEVQWTVTFYLFGLATGQLVLGPLSDRFGRRPVLLFGLVLYLAGTTGAALAQDLMVMLSARVAQGLGGCAGLALGRAMIRDLSNGDTSTRNIAVLTTAMSLSPGLAPVVATIAAPLLGWRGLLWALAAVATVLLALCAFTLPETRHGETLDWRGHLLEYWRLLSDRYFLRICLGGACATTGLYAFVANAAYILHGRFTIPLADSGPFYFSVMISITVGGLCAAGLGRRLPTDRTLIVTSSIMCAAALASIGLSLPGLELFPLYLSAIMIFALMVGLTSPVAMGRALSTMPHAVGAASGVYGSLQMAIGAILVMALGWVPVSTPVAATGIVLTCASLTSILCFSIPRRLEAYVPSRNVPCDR